MIQRRRVVHMVRFGTGLCLLDDHYGDMMLVWHWYDLDVILVWCWYYDVFVPVVFLLWGLCWFATAYVWTLSLRLFRRVVLVSEDPCHLVWYIYIDIFSLESTDPVEGAVVCATAPDLGRQPLGLGLVPWQTMQGGFWWNWFPVDMYWSYQAWTKSWIV